MPKTSTCGEQKEGGQYLATFGYGFFPEDHIIGWKRVISLMDIFLNPFGEKDHGINKYGKLRSEINEKLEKPLLQKFP